MSYGRQAQGNLRQRAAKQAVQKYTETETALQRGTAVLRDSESQAAERRMASRAGALPSAHAVGSLVLFACTLNPKP